MEAIVVGEDSIWVSIVNGGNIGVPNDIDSVVRIDPQTGETLATIKVRRGPASLAYTPGVPRFFPASNRFYRSARPTTPFLLR
jgi:hypothetical protein